MSSFSNQAAVGAVGLAAGVVGTMAVGKAFSWWCSRHQGSAVKADLGNRSSATTAAAGGEDQTRQLTLYHSFPFRSCRCAWLVNELGVQSQVTFKPVKLHGSDPRDLMAYRDVHPHGTLPSLVLEDGSVMLESSAICLYLAECFLDPSGENLLPEPKHTSNYYK